MKPKSFIHRMAAMATALACLTFDSVGQAQTFTVLHSFTDNPDGAYPYAGLVLNGSTLYGTTQLGGLSGGTVFKVNTDGSGYAVLKWFTNNMTLSDGRFPNASLVSDGSALYGTTVYGGDLTSGGHGVVFKINTDGSGYQVLNGFTNSDAVYPSSSLTLSGSTLYGMTVYGGTGDSGTVFKVNANGGGFSVIRNFSVMGYDPLTGNYTNSDGGNPYGSLVLDGSTLYGTTLAGGTNGGGTVFKLNTDASGYMVLKHFSATIYDGSTDTYTNSDGGATWAGLVLNGSTLYGTTSWGGSSGQGTVFKIGTNGSGYMVLKFFSPLVSGTNSDGAESRAGLALDGNTLYGTTSMGGSSGAGTVFKINTDGTGFRVLNNFTSTSANPYAGLVLNGSTLYGTTYSGGSSDNGTVFMLDLRTPLNLEWVGNQVVLSWTNTNFSLQSAPVVGGTFTNIPGATSPHTNPITGSQKFFRLISN